MAIFKDVEPDNIFRHLVWSVIFVIATIYYANTYIVPNSNQYKEQVRFNRVTEDTLKQTRAINEEAKMKVDTFSSANSTKLGAFSGSLSEAEMRKIIQKDFIALNISKLREKLIPKDHLKQIQYSVSGEVAINDLFSVLQIVPRLHAKHISAIVDLPLSLKKNTKGNIEFSLGVSITQSTYSRRP